MDRYFQDFIDEFGQPTATKKAKSPHIESYKGKLPDKLLEFWRQFGYCGFKKGLFWIVDPSDYEFVLEYWLDGINSKKEDKFYVIARNGFGELYLWGTNSGHKYTITPSLGWIVEEDGSEKYIKKGKSDYAMESFLSLQDYEWFDINDCNTEKPLFNQAVKKFGALEENEVFGFEPALFLGGKQTLDNLNKLDIQTHLSILADFGHREFIDEEELARRAFGD